MHFTLGTLDFDPAALGFRYSVPFAWPTPGHDRSIWRFRARFPIDPAVAPVSLAEGGTPLVASQLVRSIDLFWKDETRNPTGSHKDRALSLAATHARSIGARVMAVVSAGSTGISGAAYAARAGLASITLMGRGAPGARTYPVFAHGSRLIAIDASIDDVIAALEALDGQDGLYVASTTRSSNPHQAEAPKTIAYEIVEELDGVPDWIVVPVGGGGTISGLWRGFIEMKEAGVIERLPRLAAVVPKAYDAIAAALAGDIGDRRAFEALAYRDDIPTVLTKLSHPHPPDGIEALAALRASDGIAHAVGEDRAIDAVAAIAGRDGLYLEPSSAVALPAIEALLQSGTIRRGAVVVALACGSGFRETFVMEGARPATVEPGRLDDLPGLIGQGGHAGR